MYKCKKPQGSNPADFGTDVSSELLANQVLANVPICTKSCKAVVFPTQSVSRQKTRDRAYISFKASSKAFILR